MNILFALFVAIILSAFQYLYKRKAPLLFTFRTLTYFAILLLLLNPKITNEVKNVVKPDLYVLADNSQSIVKQKADKLEVEIFKSIINNSKFDKKFSVHYFLFSDQLKQSDSLDFFAQETNIAKCLKELKSLHNSAQIAPVLLLTDGQSTVGENYMHTLQKNDKLQVFSIVLGDSIRYEDIKIDLLNANPFVYKDNHFPVEIFVSYDGVKSVSSTLILQQNKQVVYKKKLKFDAQNNTQRLQVMLNANKVGNQHFSAYLTKISNEHNVLNNRKYFGVEVIDNAKKILLLSDIVHPDLGVIKRTLSTNKYLQIDLKNPNDKGIELNKYQTVILYQPTLNFETVFDKIQKQKLSWIIISGKHTDWQFLNTQKLFFNKQTVHTFEQYFPIENTSFSLFKLPELSTDKFTSLTDSYGNISLSGNTQIAYLSSVKGVNTQQPLWVFNSDTKQAFIAGEGLWQWCMQTGLVSQTENFDHLLQQTVQYLSLDKQFDRLKLQYQRQYFQGEHIRIRAQVLDENLAFNSKAQPLLSIKVGEKWQEIPMSNRGDFFQTNVSNLPAETYYFKVSDKVTKQHKSGSLVILPFSLEEKNLHSDIASLKKLAENTNGKVFNPSNMTSLTNDLLEDGAYPSISHITTRKVPLVDYKWLLFIILFLLAIEWLLKKIRGEL